MQRRKESLSYHDSHCASDADQLNCSSGGADGGGDGDVDCGDGGCRCLFRGHQLTVHKEAKWRSRVVWEEGGGNGT